MNCASVRKYIFAFADGQLDVKGNCDILDHLKMCPACGRLVDEHQSLRAKLGQDLARVPVPDRLKHLVLAATSQAEAAQAGQAGDAVHSTSGAARHVIGTDHRGRHGSPLVSRRFSIVRPLAVAACALLAVTAAWFLPAAVQSSSTISVPRSASAATMIAEKHLTCCAHAQDHQHAALPRALDGLGPALREHYHDAIAALTPDLSRHGYAFESVNLCGVRNKPGCAGAHLIYAAEGGRDRLSIFSVPRWDCLDKCGKFSAPPVGGFRRYEVDDESGRTLHIIAWHQNSTTYICCGAAGFDRLIEMAGPMRTALANPQANLLLALLHHRD